MRCLGKVVGRRALCYGNGEYRSADTQNLLQRNPSKIPHQPTKGETTPTPQSQSRSDRRNNYQKSTARPTQNRAEEDSAPFQQEQTPTHTIVGSNQSAGCLNILLSRFANFICLGSCSAESRTIRKRQNTWKSSNRQTRL